ncbi:transporter substrate-binding domain-containing protein [Streptosporangium sp. NPDC000563]|uniref:transporter substrate-binding domain-containing protein n=1 Tax=Streptosporangium sp. NPDC000563 TaxID=3154366 RepID=UPI003317DF5F
MRALVACSATVALVVGVGGCGSDSSEGGPAQASASSTTPESSAASAFDQALHDQLPDRIKQSKQIVFGALWETPPIIGIEPGDTSKPVGITPDLAVALGEILGVTPVWKNLQWPAQLPGLQSGNVDALFGQVSDGKEREQVIDLVGFYRSPMSVLVKEGNPHGIKSLSDACGLKIGVPSGSQQEAVVKGNSEKFCVGQGKPAITPIGYPGAQGAIVAIKGGTVDAWMDVTVSVRVIAKESGTAFENVSLPDDQIDPYMERDVAIAISKENPGLSNALAGALGQLARSGEYRKVMDRWDSGDAALPAEDIKVNSYTGLPAGQGASATPAS